MEENSSRTGDGNPVLHVVVIGFHHKKGCQVEYSYPPLIEGNKVDSHECPEEWKHLPSLALPDGSHNYEKDTIYFVMPSKTEPKTTVFCISCYRQMNAEDLLNRGADVTRGTVQKSVCVISKLPLFGLIQAKLELITHAYFDERDFSKVTLLEDTFRNLNACLSFDLVTSQQVFLGMSARDLVIHFKHKVLLLFKLFLLERKVLFFKTPVKNLCSTILSLLSLFPGMIESGLQDAATLNLSAEALELDVQQNNDIFDNAVAENPAKYSPGCEMKSNLDAATPENRNKTDDNFQCEAQKNGSKANSNEHESRNEDNMLHLEPNYIDSKMNCVRKGLGSCDIIQSPLISDLEDLLDSETSYKTYSSTKLEFNCKDGDASEGFDREFPASNGSHHGSQTSLASKESTASNDGTSAKMSSLKGRVFGAISYWAGRNSVTSPVTESKRSVAADDSPSVVELSPSEGSHLENVTEEIPMPTAPSTVIGLNSAVCGLPLQIFTNGVLCHPYLSLPYLDLLSDANVRGFVVGATNVLFKQKPQLIEVLVEIDEGKIEIYDLELRKQLHLTTEDLRFADYIVRHVTSDEKDDIFLDGTGWEGGDEWIRAQFKYYMLCLMRTSLIEEHNKDTEAFNPLFMEAWKETLSYKLWQKLDHTALVEITPGHPFQGQLSMADMKLRLSHTMQSSERGRRINQAMANTGRAVAQTSKVVGGAFSQAKSAMSSWLLTFSSPVSQSQEQASQ